MQAQVSSVPSGVNRHRCCRSYWEKAIGETSRHREYGFEETEVPPFLHSWRHSPSQPAYVMSPPQPDVAPPSPAAAPPPVAPPAEDKAPRVSPLRQHEADPLVCVPCSCHIASQSLSHTVPCQLPVSCIGLARHSSSCIRAFGSVLYNPHPQFSALACKIGTPGLMSHEVMRGDAMVPPRARCNAAANHCREAAE